jgi:hypothetical protein
LWNPGYRRGVNLTRPEETSEEEKVAEYKAIFLNALKKLEAAGNVSL